MRFTKGRQHIPRLRGLRSQRTTPTSTREFHRADALEYSPAPYSLAPVGFYLTTVSSQAV